MAAFTILALIEFCCCKDSCCFGFFFTIIQLCAVLFCLAIALFALVASNVGTVQTICGDNGEGIYKAVFDFFEHIDTLMSSIGQSNCYQSDETFLNCTTAEKDTIINQFNSLNVNDDGEELFTFNFDDFAKYWANVEENHQCSGWCKQQSKYFFITQNENGTPETSCAEVLIPFITDLIKGYGALSFLCGCFGFITFFLAAALTCKCYKAESKKE